MNDSNWYECEVLIGLKIKNYASAHISDILKGMKGCGKCLCKITSITKQHGHIYSHSWRYDIKYLPSKEDNPGRSKVSKVRWFVPIAVIFDNGKMIILPKAEIAESSELGFSFVVNGLDTPHLAGNIVCDCKEKQAITSKNEQK